MNVLIRADASSQIGMGHIMRCLTLAEALRDGGAKVAFVCREHGGNMCDYIEQQRGFSVHRLPLLTSERQFAAGPSYLYWLGADWETDAGQTESVLKQGEQVDWLVVDHYALDARWETRLRPLVGNILVIDDLADRPHECDWLLDQNYYRDPGSRYRDLVPADCSLLLGPRFALLRTDFREQRGSLRREISAVRRVLVSFGGSDLSNETTKTLQAFQLLADPTIELDVVVGMTNPHADEIKAMVKAIPGCRIHRQVENMATLMAEADLAIGAGGASNWERCCLGLPTIVVTIAPNQEETSHDLGLNGYVLYLGPGQLVSLEALYHLLAALKESAHWRATMSERCAELVDGRGVDRVVQAMLPSVVTIRPAEWQDCDDLYEWRNAEVTRRHSFESDPIELATHRTWLRKTLENPRRILLIGEREGIAVGVLRYDLDAEEVCVSVYLVPDKHGQGLGVPLLRAGNAWLFRNFPAVRKIRAEVLEANQPSQKAFLNAGFIKNQALFIYHRKELGR